MLDLAQLRELAEKATPGPWYVLDARGHKFLAAKPTPEHPYFNKTRNQDVVGDEDFLVERVCKHGISVCDFCEECSAEAARRIRQKEHEESVKRQKAKIRPLPGASR